MDKLPGQEGDDANYDFLNNPEPLIKEEAAPVVEKKKKKKKKKKVEEAKEKDFTNEIEDVDEDEVKKAVELQQREVVEERARMKAEKKRAKEEKRKGKKRKVVVEDGEGEEVKEGEEEEEEVGKSDEYPIDVYYCKVCNGLPEYCSFISTKFDECKTRLQEDNADLYTEIYEGDGAETEVTGKKKKKNKSKKNQVNEFVKGTRVKVIHLTRGAKKGVTAIEGVDGYGLNIKDIAKALGKKFACGNSIKKTDAGDLYIQLMGDPEEDELVAALQKAEEKFKLAKFDFEEGGSQKKEKKANHKAKAKQNQSKRTQ